ncbi:copper-binding protein [Noviherbaspirillum sp.]|uniref:copper-binding protein n=1 Tax=Noviherbaspirillum sp. TaxID=1926288 RepID=UPI002FE21CFB
MTSIHSLVLSAALALGTTPLIASAAGDHGGGHAGSARSMSTSTVAASQSNAASGATASSNTAMTDGEIRKVDKDAGKITIKHGELKNLDMPAMTMVFQVKDKSMLDTVKAGDKVSFMADKIDGKFTVTQIEAKK